MSNTLRFREGDRVRARVATPPIKTGMTGTIQRVYISAPDTYDVRFDDLPHLHILHAYQLELVKPADESPL